FGPAAGLMAAFRLGAKCHWLVIPCEYPFLTVAELKLLRAQYQDPVTSFFQKKKRSRVSGALSSHMGSSSTPSVMWRKASSIQGRQWTNFREQECLQCTTTVYSTQNTKEDWDDAMELLAGITVQRTRMLEQ
ncbi:hypothetical protein K469DRAFT_584168, partial [Zopfia rhizophila CBS 207.26]